MNQKKLIAISTALLLSACNDTEHSQDKAPQLPTDNAQLDIKITEGEANAAPVIVDLLADVDTQGKEAFIRNFKCTSAIDTEAGNEYPLPSGSFIYTGARLEIYPGAWNDDDLAYNVVRHYQCDFDIDNLAQTQDENGNTVELVTNRKLNLTVTGREILAENVEISGGDNLQMPINQAFVLSSIVSPVDATFKQLSWVSSDPEIAEIDAASGLITPKSVGTVTIKATTNSTDNPVVAEQVIQFSENVEKAVGAIFVAKNGNTLDKIPVPLGKPVQANVKLINQDGSQYIPEPSELTWSSFDENIIEIEQEDGLLSAKLPTGETDIKVTINNQGLFFIIPAEIKPHPNLLFTKDPGFESGTLEPWIPYMHREIYGNHTVIADAKLGVSEDSHYGLAIIPNEDSHKNAERHGVRIPFANNSADSGVDEGIAISAGDVLVASFDLKINDPVSDTEEYEFNAVISESADADWKSGFYTKISQMVVATSDKVEIEIPIQDNIKLRAFDIYINVLNNQHTSSFYIDNVDLRIKD